MNSWFKGLFHKQYQQAKLYAVVECHCGRTVEVPEGQRMVCRCGAELWWYKGGPLSVDKLCSKVPPTYAWGERLPVLIDLRFKA